MMRRIVTSLGRTAFQSRNFRAFRMPTNEPAGMGSRTGQDLHDKRQGPQESMTADSKNQTREAHQNHKQTETMKNSAGQAYNPGTNQKSNEGQSSKQNEYLKSAGRAGQGFGANPSQTNPSFEVTNKPSGQEGPGAFKSGSHMTDNMRTTGSTNTWESSNTRGSKAGEECGPGTSSMKSQQSSHTHGQECGYGEKCAPGTKNQYESKNMGASHSDQKTGQSGSKFQEGGGQAGTEFHAGWDKTQKGNQKKMDQGNKMMDEQFGDSKKQNKQDPNQQKNTKSDFNKSESRQEHH